MEIVEAIKARKSFRAFLPQPVPKQVLEEILGLAARAPSFANSQPWEVTVIGGEVMEQVKEALVELARAEVPLEPDMPYSRFAEPYISRIREDGRMLYQILGIEREDKEARKEWTLRGRKFFDAPNGFVFYLDEELGQWSLFDVALFAQSVMLAALAFGLGTCPLAAVVGYPYILRGILGIPDKKKIICGMAIGYPDWQHPANKLESPREPVAGFTQWCGF